MLYYPWKIFLLKLIGSRRSTELNSDMQYLDLTTSISNFYLQDSSTFSDTPLFFALVSFSIRANNRAVYLIVFRLPQTIAADPAAGIVKKFGRLLEEKTRLLYSSYLFSY